jgi:Schlafen, AlbA_2
MASIEDLIQALVDRPGEKLSVELKPWLDPAEKQGQWLIAKALLALRNQDGGFLVVGFNDNGSPQKLKSGLDVRGAFHVDKIQEIVSRYASKTFSVHVHFAERDGLEHPVIQVESGIRTPVACKADLLEDKGGKKLLSVDDVYVRTLNANGIASTSKVSGRDLDDLIERCFQNREADHAAFLTKIIRGISKADVDELVSAIKQAVWTNEQNPGDAEKEILEKGAIRFADEAKKRNVDVFGLGFLEGALKIEGPLRKHRASKEFLRFLDSANPSLTGWPIWLVSNSFFGVSRTVVHLSGHLGTVPSNSRLCRVPSRLHDFQPARRILFQASVRRRYAEETNYRGPSKDRRADTSAAQTGRSSSGGQSFRLRSWRSTGGSKTAFCISLEWLGRSPANRMDIA